MNYIHFDMGLIGCIAVFSLIFMFCAFGVAALLWALRWYV